MATSSRAICSLRPSARKGQARVGRTLLGGAAGDQQQRVRRLGHGSPPLAAIFSRRASLAALSGTSPTPWEFHIPARHTVVL